MNQRIEDVDGLIAALCEETFVDGYQMNVTAHTRIRAIVPRFVVNEEEPLTVARIVADNLDLFLEPDTLHEWLTEHEYDGLCRIDGNDTCGCSLSDFAPCGCPQPDCRPAWRHSDGKMYLEKEE